MTPVDIGTGVLYPPEHHLLRDLFIEFVHATAAGGTSAARVALSPAILDDADTFAPELSGLPST